MRCARPGCRHQQHDHLDRPLGVASGAGGQECKRCVCSDFLTVLDAQWLARDQIRSDLAAEATLRFKEYFG